ncbi:helix-turn-helix transcriptional regulator [Hoylesella oralis]|uniref:helix-turn-helix transcriptional regulator n=1 Tax=Hoylesella oralis TaxID=28134 RepID=UPI0028EAB921|nr:helix-turn-helix transcriptional regulator [Hoylesella oralis]
MLKINEKVLASLPKADDRFNEQYGLPGTPSREDFEARAKAWYYSELLKEERKRQNITQKQLAEMVGKKREYISSLENGKVDMQLSTFFRIAGALGLNISFG